MRVLFFDTESANGHSGVCEFGYVFCDDDFQIIEKDNIIMNPKHVEFSEYVKEILSRDVSEYRRSVDSEFVLPKIKEILDSADIIIGHTLVSDFKFLNSDNEFYRLESLKYNYIDVAKIYSRFKGINHPVKLSKMIQDLEIKIDGSLHDALSDALLTYECYKEIGKIKGYDKVTSLFNEYKSLESKMNSLKKIKPCKITKPTNDFEYRKKRIDSIVRNFESNDSVSFNETIGNKKFFIQTTFMTSHFKDAIDLIVKILKGGGKITDSRKSCDIYLFNKNEKLNKFEREEYMNIVLKGKKNAMLIDELNKMLG